MHSKLMFNYIPCFLQREHAELLSKDSMVEEIKKKGQDLIKRKRGVPGIDLVQQQLTELGRSLK